MSKFALLLASLLLFTHVAAAQPAVDAAVNAASYADAALPNGGLAQGGMFVILGRGLGPAQITIVDSFPLPTTLAGTSVRVTVGAATVDCIMIYTLASQVAAVLPSNTPLGNGTLTVTFNGQTSASRPVRVVRSSFGIFSLNQAGSGPGIFTDPNFAVNMLLAAGNPGSLWFIWGTGLGPVTGNEAGGALPGDLPGLDVNVLVGGQPATVTYRGRSGCCAGIDQVLITLPAGVTGCHVPVVVIVGGVPSNYTTISIAPNGSVCSDAGGLSTQDLSEAQTSGSLTAGNVTLLRQNLRTVLAPGFADLVTTTDTASASFASFSSAQLIATQSVSSIANIGACTVYQFRGTSGALTDPVTGQLLDAGATLNLTGPGGARTLSRLANGAYAGELGGSSLSIPGLPGGGTPYLEPGTYTVTNAAGAAAGSFSATLELGAGLTPVNLATIGTVPRNAPLTLTWTGGAAGQFAQISGHSAVSSGAGAAFQCRAPVAAGTFTVPVAVLSALPATFADSGGPDGLLSIGTVTGPVRFTATGLAFGQFSAVRIDSRRIVYE